jgi:pimeloyl-ACP methyl ester carboxylesterase
VAGFTRDDTQGPVAGRTGRNASLLGNVSGMSPHTYRQPGTIVTEHTFGVPLDHDRPDGPQLEIFAREIVAAEAADAGLPWLFYLEGGPGHGALRPVGRDAWLDRALREFRVLLMDQRGTGRSTPASRQTLAALGSPREQADYLAKFRADNIIADAELIRQQVTGGQPWSVLGQSFGGFCTVAYLSRAPRGLREAFITGGLPGLETGPDDVYQRTYPMVAVKNRAHYDRYPMDIEQVRRVAELLAAAPVRLPGGLLLTVAGFQHLGMMLGSSSGSHTLHYLLETALAGDELSDAFQYRVESILTKAAAPLFALLHEAEYSHGPATNWSAQRVRADFPEFDAVKALETGEPVFFTGEMIYPWMFETDPSLAPLAEAAELLAQREGWPPVYDGAQLAANPVPAAAAVYLNDMYVPVELSLATAASIRGLRPWVTSEYEHDGLRVSQGGVLDRLIGLARGDLER